MREQLVCGREITCIRYTLTYSEGTKFLLISSEVLAIHPHIQWGNSRNFWHCYVVRDTPSHTVREHCVSVLSYVYGRYTLIQWGNDISFKQLNHINDTPSHTVREPLSIYAAFSRSKYLVVQFAQKPFVILVTYLICRKISFVNKKS